MGFFWLFRDKEGAVKKVPKKKRAANPQRSGNIRICGEDRNSYSKTDHDATFMRMKRDYMGNDQLLPGYNIQFGVCDEFIAIYDVKHYASDMDCFKPLMEKFNRLYGTYPEYPVADAGFGSFDNYLFCEEHGMKKYMKFTMFKKLIYTTNTIEGFNRQLRKVTKSKSVFPTDDSLLKMLYLAMMDITKKWTGRRQDWSVIYAQLAIFFGDRIAE